MSRGNGGSVFTGEQLAALQAWTKRYFHPRMGLIEALRDVQDWQGEASVEPE